MRELTPSGPVLAVLAALALALGGCESVRPSRDASAEAEVTAETGPPDPEAIFEADAAWAIETWSTPEAVLPDAPAEADGDDHECRDDACATPCEPRNLPACVDGAVWYLDSCGAPWFEVEVCAKGCTGGSCLACEPRCDGRQCGPDGCSGSCGPCGPGQACTSAGTCCDRRCDGRQCGPDGCGGTCGAPGLHGPGDGGCPEGLLCDDLGRCTDCLPACDGKACGSDGCGGSCGACGPGANCDLDACVTGILPGGCTTTKGPPLQGWACLACVVASRPYCAVDWSEACVHACEACGTTCAAPDDADGDGFADPFDCREHDPTVHPGAAETCNARDDDCDGEVDEGACDGCLVETWGGHLYLLCADARDWFGAQYFCRQHGYRLASIDTAAENAWLVTAVNQACPNCTCWFGYNDLASEGSFVYDNGSLSTYVNWYKGVADNAGGHENCGELVLYGAYGGQWNDGDCSIPITFLCELGCGGEADGQPDADGDGLGDGCDDLPSDPLNDADGDGWGAPDDDCPWIHDPVQPDADGDGVGDACEGPSFP